MDEDGFWVLPGRKSVFICENPCPIKKEFDFSDKLLGRHCLAEALDVV
jgi:hypothetical protein